MDGQAHPKLVRMPNPSRCLAEKTSERFEFVEEEWEGSKEMIPPLHVLLTGGNRRSLSVRARAANLKDFYKSLELVVYPRIAHLTLSILRALALSHGNLLMILSNVLGSEPHSIRHSTFTPP